MKRGGKLKWLLLKSLLLCYSNTLQAQQSSDQQAQEQFDSTQSSAEFFEFLADWGEVDEETYEIIEHHGLLDSDEQQEEK